MIEHIFTARRDQAVFVGNADDIVPEHLVPPLPRSAAGPANFSISPATSCRRVLRSRPRSRRDRRLRRGRAGLLVTVGGSEVSAATCSARDRRLPVRPRAGARAADDRRRGPADQPTGDLPAHEGSSTRLRPRPLPAPAACDLAVVQGGLTTSMELTANPPVPLLPAAPPLRGRTAGRHRLDRYGAGRRMDFEHETPETIAAPSPRPSARPSTTGLSRQTAPLEPPRHRTAAPVTTSRAPLGISENLPGCSADPRPVPR